jgi:hypothetical protein
MKCSVCHDELPDPDGICPGRLPGAIGLVEYSAGPCKSTAEQRAQVTAERIARQKVKEVEVP